MCAALPDGDVSTPEQIVPSCIAQHGKLRALRIDLGSKGIGVKAYPVGWARGHTLQTSVISPALPDDGAAFMAEGLEWGCAREAGGGAEGKEDRCNIIPCGQ
jgi:hypothetical protein